MVFRLIRMIVKNILCYLLCYLILYSSVNANVHKNQNYSKHEGFLPTIFSNIHRNIVKYHDLNDRDLKFSTQSLRSLKSSKNTNRKSDEGTKNNFFYYISSNEGIASHIYQLEEVFIAANVTGRSVYLVGFYSKHYPDLKDIHMCDIFALPSNLVCIPDNNITVLTHHKCIYTGEIHPASFYGWENITQPFSKTFDYNTVECVAGPTTPYVGLYKRPSQKPKFLPFPPFSKKYLDMVPVLRQALGVKDRNYITVHWRRGDQLTVRCGRLDNSSNCDNEKRFVSDLQKDIASHVPNYRSAPIVTYIATNEMDAKVLNYLKLHHYKVFFNLKKALMSIDPTLKLSTLDIFMVDLLLMCDSKYFFSWGTSSVNTMVFKYCRSAENSDELVTIFDGKFMNNSHFELGDWKMLQSKIEGSHKKNSAEHSD